MSTRVEKDALGEMDIPAGAYYGIHTARSLNNFDVAGRPLPIEIIHAVARLKRACATANARLGDLESTKANAIAAACERVIAGEFDDQFGIDLFQAGSGTSSNMNINEVLANIASEQLGGEKGNHTLIHPNDHVNMGQSTNNIIPSSIRLAAVRLNQALFAKLDRLLASLRLKEREFHDVLKAGRTHLQDAVPITLGQEFGAYSRAIEKAKSRIESARDSLYELGVGGNAVGTGLNTKAEFRKTIIDELNKNCDEKFYPATNGVESTQFLSDIAHYSAAMRLLAGDILKIANDLRLLSSGPNTGICEINLPAIEPGSSIMPGKINPSICEAANMACIQVMGADHVIGIACAAGQLELNTHMPVIGANLIDSIGLLTRCCAMLAEKCVAGITANTEVCFRNFNASTGLATILNPILGYDRTSELVKESLASKKPIKTLIIEKELMDKDALNKLLKNSTGPANPNS